MSIQGVLRHLGRILLLLLLLGGGVASILYTARILPEGRWPPLAVYACFGLISTAFLFFGVFVTAFYSSDARFDNLLQRLAEVRNLLAEHHKEQKLGQVSVSAGPTPPEGLEKQIRQVRTQVDLLQKLVSSIETKLDSIHRETEAIRAALTGSLRSDSVLSAPMSVESRPEGYLPTSEVTPKEPPQDGGEESRSPAWRKSLNNILEEIEEDEGK